jgi:hypothetical protein
VVHLLAHNGRYLAVCNEEVCASPKAKQGFTEFIVRSGHSHPLKHRSRVCLENRGTGESLLADPSEDCIQARSHDFGLQQEFVLEKAPKKGRKRSLTPEEKRRSLTPEKTTSCKKRQVLHNGRGCTVAVAKDVSRSRDLATVKVHRHHC